jgi:hypothetical protein
LFRQAIRPKAGFFTWREWADKLATFSLKLDAYASNTNSKDRIKEFQEFVSTMHEAETAKPDPSP